MGLNVLSCFDGISCGQLALQRAGIEVDNYFASEIDKYAIKITQTRFPKTVQLGDIQNWRSWNLPKIDLIIAGSPCQGFSKSGFGLNFDDPRSRLFFTFCDILVFYNPDNYMLENVKMKKVWIKTITDYMKVDPVLVNSALVSAQQRERLYWANWKFDQPEDKGIYLKDILEDGEVDRVRLYAIDPNYHKGGNPRQYFEKGRRQLVFVAGLEKGRRLHDGKNLSRNFREGSRIYSPLGKSPALTAQPKGGEGGYTGLVQIREKSKTVRVGGRSSPFGSKQNWDSVSEYRKLTVLECERLQTLPDGYTDCGVSDSQRYKGIGNGFTVDAVAHILSALKEKLHGAK